MTDYQQLYQQQIERLNVQQRQAVETLEGPVLVFAGPGTGKTQILTLRIANLIKQGLAQPGEILALTFTKAAAQNMQARLAGFIGAAAFQVNFNTFHGFCQEIIETEPEYFTWAQESKVLDDLEKLELLESIIRTEPLKILRPAGKKYFYLNQLTQQIQTLKREYVKVEDYENLLEKARQQTQEKIGEENGKKRPSQRKILDWNKILAKQEELLLVYRRYEQTLHEINRYDYEDMILATIEALKNNPDLLLIYQEKFQYLLVDEYQDTNNAQDEVMNLLASFWGENANIFVVGDPQQSIYRFQGANLANFLGFSKRYPLAKTITLDIGYRCSNKTYQIAYDLIKTMDNKDQGLGELKALKNFQNREGEAITLTACASGDSEIIQICQQIIQLQKSGVAWDKMAIIYRNNKESERIVELCSHYQIPVEIEGGSNILEQNLIKNVILLLKLIENLENNYLADDYLYKIMWRPWAALDQVKILSLYQVCRQEKISLKEVILDPNHLIWQTKKEELDINLYQDFLKLGAKLKQWKADSFQKDIATLLQKILEESGILTWVQQQEEKVFLLTYLYTFERTLSNWSQQRADFNLQQLFEMLQTMRNHNLKITAQDMNIRQGAVSATTVHKAKGREWDFVFIYGLNEGVWSKIRKKATIDLPEGIIKEQTDLEKIGEEVRLLFVAITRAKIQTRISWHLTERIELKETAKAPSQFITILEEQNNNLTQRMESSLKAEAIAQEMLKLLKPALPIKIEEASRAFLQKLVKSLQMSASLLNDYLADSEIFLQRQILKAPNSEKGIAIEFGNSIHLALEKGLKNKLNGGEILPLEQVQEVFTKDFALKNIEEPDKSQYLKIGLSSLADYYQKHWKDTNQKILAVEKNFGVKPKIYLGDVPLIGKIDRIDLVDESSKIVKVVDYKTGRQLTENEILGKTSSSKLSEAEKALPEAIQSSYKRQLLFYKLLVEIEPSAKYKVVSGMLDFVKVEAEKKAVQRELNLADDEVDLLKELIQKVWREIQDLKFLENLTTAKGEDVQVDSQAL